MSIVKTPEDNLAFDIFLTHTRWHFIIWQDQSCDSVKNATIIKQMTFTDRTKPIPSRDVPISIGQTLTNRLVCVYAMQKNKSIKANYFFCRLLELRKDLCFGRFTDMLCMQYIQFAMDRLVFTNHKHESPLI